MWVDLLLIAGLVFFVDLLFVFLVFLVFLAFFGLFLGLVLLTLVSHGFLLGFCRVLNLGHFLFNGWGRLRQGFNLLK